MRQCTTTTTSTGGTIGKRNKNFKRSKTKLKIKTKTKLQNLFDGKNCLPCTYVCYWSCDCTNEKMFAHCSCTPNRIEPNSNEPKIPYLFFSHLWLFLMVDVCACIKIQDRSLAIGCRMIPLKIQTQDTRTHCTTSMATRLTSGCFWRKKKIKLRSHFAAFNRCRTIRLTHRFAVVFNGFYSSIFDIFICVCVDWSNMI